MISLTVSANFSEVDKTIDRLMKVLNPRVIHNLGARVARKQVKQKYASRFDAQVSPSSGWQMWKLSLDQLPYGGKPGFFTSSTYRAISAKSSGESGEVYLKGKYPSTDADVSRGMPFKGTIGNAIGNIISETETCLKWSDGGRIELSGYFGKIHGVLGAEKTGYNYMDSGGQFPSKYGADAGLNIEWMFLDGQDVDAVSDSIERLLDSAVRNDIPGIRALFKNALIGEDSSEPVDAVADEVASVQADERAARIEAHTGMPISDALKAWAVKSVDELIRKLESRIETQQLKYEKEKE